MYGRVLRRRGIGVLGSQSAILQKKDRRTKGERTIKFREMGIRQESRMSECARTDCVCRQFVADVRRAEAVPDSLVLDDAMPNT